MIIQKSSSRSPTARGDDARREKEEKNRKLKTLNPQRKIQTKETRYLTDNDWNCSKRHAITNKENFTIISLPMFTRQLHKAKNQGLWRTALPRSLASAASSRSDDIVLRLVSINDVYHLFNLPKLATFLSTLGRDASSSAGAFDGSILPSAVCICGDFISPSTLSSMDGGRGHVATLRQAGITHASLGNHEADVKLEVLRRRISQLGRSALLLNGNVVGWLDDMGGSFNAASSFGQRSTAEMDVLTSDDGRVRVGLTGLLSDEPSMFRTPRKFRGLPIESVTKRYDQIRSRLINSTDATVLVPMTHQSLQRDIELAQHMLEQGLCGVILGGHEHNKIYERVEDDATGNYVEIVKTGQDAERAAVVDLRFDAKTKSLKRVEVNFEELLNGVYEDDAGVLGIANDHLQKLKDMENSVVVDVRSQLPSVFTVEGGTVTPPLSSERARFQQTTVGALFCQAIKTELETDVCIINGAPIKGANSYPKGTMSHVQIMEEVPFPLKMVVVEMTRGRLKEAIEYSRIKIEEGKDGKAQIPATSNNGLPVKVERRGYLQTDFDFIASEGKGDDEEALLVALPRNLMAGFCKIRPLMELGQELKDKGMYPENDDFIKASDLIVRFCCKERWAASVLDLELSFEQLDLNGDGILDREEIRQMLRKMLDEEPGDRLLNDMISAIDQDNDGQISSEEFDEILKRVNKRRQ